MTAPPAIVRGPAKLALADGVVDTKPAAPTSAAAPVVFATVIVVPVMALMNQPWLAGIAVLTTG